MTTITDATITETIAHLADTLEVAAYLIPANVPAKVRRERANDLVNAWIERGLLGYREGEMLVTIPMG